MAAIYIILLIAKLLIEFPFAKSEHPLLLLMSFDGFRYDFISPTNTPNLWSLAENGVRIPAGVKTQVTTLTAPNHHSIATGLYQESHGIIDNTFYDPVFKEHYDVWGFGGRGAIYQNSKTSKWYTGEPIWQTNMQIAGRMSGTYYWPIGDAVVNNVKPKHKYKTWPDYNDDFDVWKSEIDELLTWFNSANDPVNFALYYNAQPDALEHRVNIFGPEVESMVRQVDDLIGYLIIESKRIGLYSKLNIIITSDHGFVNTPGDYRSTMSLEGYLDTNMFTTNSYSIFPVDNKPETAEKIYRNLTTAAAGGVKIKAWRKTEFPDRYGWKNNRRIGPVVYFYDHTKTDWKNQKLFQSYGTHFAFLNDFTDMNVVFVAHGPAFKQNFSLTRQDVENVDYYPLMCKILGVNPAPNNGSLNRIDSILTVDNVKSDKILLNNKTNTEKRALIALNHNNPNDAQQSSFNNIDLTTIIEKNKFHFKVLIVLFCFIIFLLIVFVYFRFRLLRGKCRQVGWFRKFAYFLSDSKQSFRKHQRHGTRTAKDNMPFLEECSSDECV